MPIECDRDEMEFRPVGGTSVVVRSPEELGAKQIWVHPEVMIRKWGVDAPVRYMESLKEHGMGIVQPHAMVNETGR